MSDGEVYWKSGEWKEEITNDESSNWREAENVVVTFKEAVDSGMAEGAEVFLITDNAVFEGTYYKGYSVSKKLSWIILRLHEAAQQGGLILHVFHAAGTRMKEFLMERMSREYFSEGIFKGGNPLQYFPFDKSIWG